MKGTNKIALTTLVALTVAAFVLVSAPADNSQREVYRDARTIWSFNPSSVVLKNDASGCEPYFELWLKITDRDRGYYDQVRVLLKKDSREFKFTDSLGYDPAGQVAEA